MFFLKTSNAADINPLLSLPNFLPILRALKIGKKFGSDKRGLMSAALLVFKKNNPPLNIRVDHDTNPLVKLEKILKMTNKTKYKEWLKKLPTK